MAQEKLGSVMKMFSDYGTWYAKRFFEEATRAYNFNLASFSSAADNFSYLNRNSLEICLESAKPFYNSRPTENKTVEIPVAQEIAIEEHAAQEYVPVQEIPQKEMLTVIPKLA